MRSITWLAFSVRCVAVRLPVRLAGAVVFRASDGTFAIVHLSWIRKANSPPWPQTTRHGGFIAVELAMDQHEH
jgi:hypothetical protein